MVKIKMCKRLEMLECFINIAIYRALVSAQARCLFELVKILIKSFLVSLLLN